MSPLSKRSGLRREIEAMESGWRLEMSALRREIEAMGSGSGVEISRLRTEMRTMGSDLRTEMRTMGSDLRTEIRALRAEMKSGFDQIQENRRNSQMLVLGIAIFLLGAYRMQDLSSTRPFQNTQIESGSSSFSPKPSNRE